MSRPTDAARAATVVLVAALAVGVAACFAALLAEPDEGPCPTGTTDCTVVYPHPVGGGS